VDDTLHDLVRVLAKTTRSGHDACPASSIGTVPLVSTTSAYGVLSGNHCICDCITLPATRARRRHPIERARQRYPALAWWC
jgi:hypothetical protein